MTETATKIQPRLKAKYAADIRPALQEQFSYGNPMQVPTLTKVVVNMGVGEAAKDSKLIEGAVRDLTAITGQKPVVTKARKSIAQFKVCAKACQLVPTPPCAMIACGNSLIV